MQDIPQLSKSISSNKKVENKGLLSMPPNSQSANPTHGGTAVSQTLPASVERPTRPPTDDQKTADNFAVT